MNSKSNELHDQLKLRLLATTIEARTGYKWIPTLTRYGTGSIVLVFDVQEFPPYVACKIILEPFERSRLRYFLREVMRSLKAQGHPLIVRVSMVTVIAVPPIITPRPVIFMQYCEKNLREYIIEKGKLKVDEALALAVQIVRGLLYLKQRGFVAHQDLKPENILLQNICQWFGREEMPQELCYRPKIADFGLVNAWLEAGIPGGSNPYRAPEQFACHVSKKRAEELCRAGLFNPDVFALGVILTEMLTGKHPSDIPSSDVMKEEIARNSSFWHDWSINGVRIVEVENEELKQLILGMLDPNPQFRPSLERVYNELLKMLRNVNPKLYEQVENLIRYYDEIAQSYEEFLGDVNTWRKVLNLAELPEAKEVIDDYVQYLKQRLQEFELPKRVEDVHKYARIWRTIGETLALIDLNRYKDEIRRIGLEVLNTVVQWLGKIKPEHTLLKIKMTDDEARAMVLWEPLDILKKVMSEEELGKLVFSEYNDYVKALYLYIKASDYHNKASYDKAIELLSEALKYSPNNKTLKFFRALWKYHLAETLSTNMCILLEEAVKEFEEVIMLAPTWEEPSERLKNAKDMHNKLCTH
ncbi:MAG: protein kinase [Thermosphaera sp.]|nr:protein kinase [Thermosphaera sp.]